MLSTRLKKNWINNYSVEFYITEVARAQLFILFTSLAFLIKNGATSMIVNSIRFFYLYISRNLPDKISSVDATLKFI